MSKLVVTLTVDDLQTIIRAEVSAALRERGPSVVNAPAVLTPEEAAAFLKMPVDVLRKRARAGELPSFKMGSLWRFRVADLDAWVESLKKRAG